MRNRPLCRALRTKVAECKVRLQVGQLSELEKIDNIKEWESVWHR